MDESTLVARAAGGDEPAFELLVRRHIEAVWRLARSMLDDDFDAEDAVQDTLVKAYRALSTYRGESAFRTWLLSIAHRTCFDRLRARRPEVVSLGEVRERRGRDDTPELRLALEETLNRLSAEERVAFVLVHVLSYTREEAAGICGVPASTMRARVTRARARLAEMLAEAERAENGA